MLQTFKISINNYFRRKKSNEQPKMNKLEPMGTTESQEKPTLSSQMTAKGAADQYRKLYTPITLLKANTTGKPESQPHLHQHRRMEEPRLSPYRAVTRRASNSHYCNLWEGQVVSRDFHSHQPVTSPLPFMVSVETMGEILYTPPHQSVTR